MAKWDFKRISVVDLEATCWSEEEPCPTNEISEIIEFGITTVFVPDLSIESKRSILIIPIESSVSRFCTDLTGHTERELRMNGVQFSDALNTLTKLGTSSRIMASWGNYDRKMVMEQCQRRGLEYPFSLSHWNVKDMFTIAQGRTRGVGVQKALNMLGWEFEGRPHSGGDDAYNIAKILVWVLKKMQGKESK